jgi:UDP-glucose 4-epimerase
MKILVTGGAGFIGSHVVDAYIRDGHEVVVLDDLSTGFERNINKGAKFFRMDVRGANMSDLFSKEGPDIVNHHAAQMDVRRSVEDPLFDADVNILGSLNLIQNSIRHGVKKVIYISSGGAVYGEPQYLPVDEHHPINPICQYGISKHTVEHYLRLHSELNGLSYTVLRYPNVYGPRQNPYGEAGVNAIFIGQMLRDQRCTIFGDGEQLRDYVYIDDIVAANRIVLDQGDNGIYNLGSERGTSVNEIHHKLSELIKFGGSAEHGFPRKGEIKNIYLSSGKAKQEIGWQATVDLDEGMERTIDFFRKNLGLFRRGSL